jgi:hypothetical protein
LLPLNTQSLNDCRDREQTVKKITGRFSAPQELTQRLSSLVDNGIYRAHCLYPHHTMGDHHGIRRSRYSLRALEKGKDRWSAGAVQAVFWCPAS